MTEQLLPPANWYADPEGSGRWRYWDGAAWTGVYLNQPEQGSGPFAQWWEMARPAVFALAAVGVVAVAAFEPDMFFPTAILAILLMPERRGIPPVGYQLGLLAALAAALAVRDGWGAGVGTALCGAILMLVGRNRDRLPRWLVWLAVVGSLGIFAMIAAT